MQLATQHIDLARFPLPIPQAQLFMLSIQLKGSTVRPRTVEFILDEACAKQLWRLHKNRRLDTRFALVATERRVAFMNIEQVRFDLVGEPAAVTYSVAQIARLVKFNV